MPLDEIEKSLLKLKEKKEKYDPTSCTELWERIKILTKLGLELDEENIKLKKENKVLKELGEALTKRLEEGDYF